MTRKFTQLPVRGMTAEEVLALWQQGKLFRAVEQKVISAEEIKDNVRAYVAQIRSLATERFRDSVDELWDAVLDDGLYASLIIPDVRSRKCRQMNKNGVMRLVGVMRSLKVYADVTDSALCVQLEQQEGDCSYRAYLGKGVEDNIRKELIKLTRKFVPASF